jgi:hypothetical protein
MSEQVIKAPLIDARQPRGEIVSTSFLLSTMTVCVVFALWVLVTSMGWANELFLPGPTAVWGALVKATTKGYQVRRCSNMSVPVFIEFSPPSRSPVSSVFHSAW